ncbi:ADP,ATP carrier protein 1, chloroplastic [Panicum miliaceum]|uniref:ADP,ATP carrier protein n=1 Tax=Panicum miliaceum TaxID=4540 RepID=A0A3L6SR44_PANMI|nr:ADP,ATP carrier protein 1, chloroplastic [Panicum miliaceum]
MARTARHGSVAQNQQRRVAGACTATGWPAALHKRSDGPGHGEWPPTSQGRGAWRPRRAMVPRHELRWRWEVRGVGGGGSCSVLTWFLRSHRGGGQYGSELALRGAEKFNLVVVELICAHRYSIFGHAKGQFRRAGAAGSGGAPQAAAAAAVPAPQPEEATKKFLGIDVKTLKKIVPLGLMFFCILFNYTILRDTKDVLVVTAKGSSAEIIPFLKTWVNLPMAIGFMLLYTKLSNVLSREALFYTVIFPFIAFFGAFAFVLYPLRDAIHPTALADKLLAALGPSFLGPVAILRIWSFCLFYVMAELWGSVVISVLFWGFANQITTVDEAKEFYPLFGLGANIALIFSGRTVKYFSNLRKTLGPGIDGWEVSLKGMMSIVVLLGLVITSIYWGVNKFVLNDPSLPKSDRKKKKEKPKLGMKESLKVLLSSRYVRDLATLVVAYGISINLVEVTWKSKLKAQFPSPNEYSSFMGDFSTATGIATFTMMLLGRFILRKFGWGVAAMITPTVLLLTGVGFFSLILFGQPLTPMLATMGMTPLLAAVYVGAMQNIFSKSAKYSLFDPCKEMAYIPLDEDMKVKGKAAIDVVCNPLGKSGGALIQQFMILTFGSLANSTPYLGGILLVIVLAWLGAASSLDKQFSSLAKEDFKKEKAAQEKVEPSLLKAPAEGTDILVEQTNGSLKGETKSSPSNSSPIQ